MMGTELEKPRDGGVPTPTKSEWSRHILCRKDRPRQGWRVSKPTGLSWKRGGGLDESPHCYKHLQGVLDAHEGTIKILHTLRPIGVAMADTEDPYRD